MAKSIDARVNILADTADLERGMVGALPRPTSLIVLHGALIAIRLEALRARLLGLLARTLVRRA